MMVLIVNGTVTHRTGSLSLLLRRDRCDASMADSSLRAAPRQGGGLQGGLLVLVPLRLQANAISWSDRVKSSGLSAVLFK